MSQQLLLCYLLATLLLTATLTTAAAPPIETVSAGLMHPLGIFGKRGGGAGVLGKKVETVTVKGGDNNGDKQKHDGGNGGEKQSSSGKGRRFKVCMTHNQCYKKKLVCPKKCKNSPNRLSLNHFPGQCVLNCKKCVAHC